MGRQAGLTGPIATYQRGRIEADFPSTERLLAGWPVLVET
jgi:hypothetical protein